jgi:hypothetical protein
MKKLSILLLLMGFTLLMLPATGNSISPTFLQPVETTKGIYTSYSLSFTTENEISEFAVVKIIFPSQFDARYLLQFSKCEFSFNSDPLEKVDCSLKGNTFTIALGSIKKDDQLTFVFFNIRNPSNEKRSSNFRVKLCVNDVDIAENGKMGEVPFTSTPSNQYFLF